MEKSMLPKLKDVMLKRGFLILPILSIVVMLTIGYTASFAAMVGILVAILGSYIPTLVKLARKLLGKDNNSIKSIVSNTSGLKLKDYFSALEGGARSIVNGVCNNCKRRNNKQIYRL